MKKKYFLVSLIILWLIAIVGLEKCTAQQNGTFRTIYVDSIQPVFPSNSHALNFANKIQPWNLYFNDTLAYDWIFKHSDHGGGVIDTTKLVTKYGLNNGLTSPSSFNTLLFNNFEFLADIYDPLNINNRNRLSVGSTNISLSSNVVQYIIDSTGMHAIGNYSFQNSFNPRWIPDKNYVDSTNFFQLGYDGDPTFTNTALNIQNNISTYLLSFGKLSTNKAFIKTDSLSAGIGYSSTSNGSTNISSTITASKPRTSITAQKSIRATTINITPDEGCYYTAHSTVNKTTWIPDKFYVDSVTSGSGGSQSHASSYLVSPYNLTSSAYLGDTIVSVKVLVSGFYQITVSSIVNASAVTNAASLYIQGGSYVTGGASPDGSNFTFRTNIFSSYTTPVNSGEGSVGSTSFYILTAGQRVYYWAKVAIVPTSGNIQLTGNLLQIQQLK
jgi:hypothetical protein